MACVWVVGTFYLKMEDLFSYSRAVFSIFMGFAALGMILNRLLIVWLVRIYRNKYGHYRRVLIFGGAVLGAKITRRLQRQLFVPFRIVGFTDDISIPGVNRLTEEEALEQIRQGEVDHVIVDLRPRRIRLLLEVARALEREGVPLQITPTIFPGIHLKPRVDQIGSIPIMELCGGELSFGGLFVKRVTDVVLSLVGLVICSVPFLIIAVIIKLTSPGPVFHIQERVGLNGKRFRMLKFRTMKVDAEAGGTGPVWADPDDQRRTAFGCTLRRTNLDELPQLLNVLKGDMSLVGPRPERPEFVEQFKPIVARYSHKHWVKPGITGWAQVNGWRGQTDLKRRIEHDIYYIERWSIWFDFKILLLTIIRGYKNAY
jgi:Undecaprenyl-phosphate glucose phosphotransferase